MAIHPLAMDDGLIVRIQPPLEPAFLAGDHIPCDIVLIIDTSGSMRFDAPAPIAGENGRTVLEDFGFSILDLVKHAARTIVATLDENDTLGIVTFSSDAHVSSPQSGLDSRYRPLTDDVREDFPGVNANDFRQQKTNQSNY